MKWLKACYKRHLMNWFLATTVTQHVYLRTYIISYIIKKKKNKHTLPSPQSVISPSWQGVATYPAHAYKSCQALKIHLTTPTNRHTRTNTRSIEEMQRQRTHIKLRRNQWNKCRTLKVWSMSFINEHGHVQ